MCLCHSECVTLTLGSAGLGLVSECVCVSVCVRVYQSHRVSLPACTGECARVCPSVQELLQVSECVRGP